MNKFKKSLESLYTLSLINPHKHWIVFLKIFIVVFFFLIVFNFYFLYKINNEKVLQVNIIPHENKSLLKEKLLKDILNTFNKKAQMSEELKKK